MVRPKQVKPKLINGVDEELSGYILKARKVKTAILAPDSVPAEKQESFASNTDSPFMRLPPELRNRIYLLLLTGHTVHVSGHEDNKSNKRLSIKRKLTRRICARDTTDEEDADEIQAHATNSLNYAKRQGENFGARHKACTGRGPNQFNLAILQTSRQIHHEAALLFYQENTFSFDSIINLEAFLEFLVPAQVQAVQRITFVYHSFKSNTAFEEHLKAKVGGLQSLVIFLENLRPLHIEFISKITECLSRFQRLSIESAKVAAVNMNMVWVKATEASLEKDWVGEVPEKVTKPSPKSKGKKAQSMSKKQ